MDQSKKIRNQITKKYRINFNTGIITDLQSEKKTGTFEELLFLRKFIFAPYYYEKIKSLIATFIKTGILVNQHGKITCKDSYNLELLRKLDLTQKPFESKLPIYFTFDVTPEEFENFHEITGSQIVVTLHNGYWNFYISEKGENYTRSTWYKPMSPIDKYLILNLKISIQKLKLRKTFL